jgi:tetratricopeptide (TPR) repeat protein
MEQSKGLGKIAIKKGMATQEQVSEALQRQEKLRKEGKIRLLGEILRKSKVLDEEQVRGLLALQLQMKFAKEERELLDLAKKRHMITAPVADKVSLIQKNKVAMSRYRRIGDILVDRKFLTVNARDALLRALRRCQLTGEDAEALLDEKMTTGDVQRTEEIPRDDAMLTKYRGFIDKQLKLGKSLRVKKKFREAIDAWRVILEVLVMHPEAEKRIRESESILENMEAHQLQARKHLQMALREWEGVLKIDPTSASVLDAMESGRNRLDALLGRSVGGTGRRTNPASAAAEAPPSTGGESAAGDLEAEEDQKRKRLLRGAKRFDKQGNTKEAAKRYQELLAVDPGNPDAIAALQAMERRKLTTALLGCLTLFLALVVGGVATWFILGGTTCLHWLLRAGTWIQGVLG